MTRGERRRGAGGAAPWSRKPIAEGAEETEAAAEDDGLVARAAHAAAKDVSAALRGGRALAERVGGGVRAGLGRVEGALEDPSIESAADFVSKADLPEIDDHDALASLAIRLDREADLWRGVALRQQTRLAWSERLAMSASFVALFGGVALAAIGGFRALIAGDASSGCALLLATAALSLVAAAFTVSRVAANVRQTELAVARDALARADLAELRVHRVGALMELRRVDAAAYHLALRAFERDVR